MSNHETRNQSIDRSTDRPKITRRRSCSRRDSTRIPITLITINRGADFVAIFTSLKTIPSINISVRTANCADTRKDSVRAINDNRIQATGEATIRSNIIKRHGDDIYDVETEKDIYFGDYEQLKLGRFDSRALSNTRTDCDPPDVEQRHERNDQDIISRVLPGFDGIFSRLLIDLATKTDR
ncbi:hypothetical protein ACTXT7_000948 [Hymenolepis weldensis]